MTNQEFENLREEFLSKEAELLEWKGQEYGSNYDRLLNFKEMANFTGLKEVDVCFLYLMKHIQSIGLAIKDREYKKRWFWHDEHGNEGLKQRIADARNYLLLLAACIEEEIRDKHNG